MLNHSENVKREDKSKQTQKAGGKKKFDFHSVWLVVTQRAKFDEKGDKRE